MITREQMLKIDEETEEILLNIFKNRPPGHGLTFSVLEDQLCGVYGIGSNSLRRVLWKLMEDQTVVPVGDSVFSPEGVEYNWEKEDG